MRKKILGLKVSGPHNNGKSIVSGDVAWALIEEMEKEGKIENISPDDLAKSARQAIGFLFKQLRSEKHLSIETLSDIIDVEKAEVINFESGETTYSIDLFFKILNATNSFFYITERGDGEHLDLDVLKNKA